MGADTVNITKIIALRTGGSLGVPEDRAFESAQNARAPQDAGDSTGVGQVSRPQSQDPTFQNFGTHPWPRPSPQLEIEKHWVTWEEKELTRFPISSTTFQSHLPKSNFYGACSLTIGYCVLCAPGCAQSLSIPQGGSLESHLCSTPLALHQSRLPPQFRTRKQPRCHCKLLGLSSWAFCTMLFLAPKIKTIGGGFCLVWFFILSTDSPGEHSPYSTFLTSLFFLHFLFSSHFFYLMTKILITYIHLFTHWFTHSTKIYQATNMNLMIYVLLMAETVPLRFVSSLALQKTLANFGH